MQTSALKSAAMVSACLAGLVLGHPIVVPGEPEAGIPEELIVRMAEGEQVTDENYICGTVHPNAFFEELQKDIRAGKIVDPKLLPKPVLPLGRVVKQNGPQVAGDGIGPQLGLDDLFLYEDSVNLLSSNFTNGQLFNFMGRATNALLEREGDRFDFVAFWLSFQPHHQIGSAFYLGLENTTNGLGIGNIHRRDDYGVIGENVEGWVMMWNVNNWNPGTGPNADRTRLVLGQEFEHRWAMFLNPTSDGYPLQGNNGSCGRDSHWNLRMDGQGSGMEIAEWVGALTLTRPGGRLNFNSDTGGVFSFADLYLMGYVSPGEMDAGNSQFRYMIDSNCEGSYSGPVAALSSADIVATNGPRLPSSATAQKDFRSGWIMVHRPGDLPSQSELTRALAINQQHQVDWFDSTLGRGAMDNSIDGMPSGDVDGDGDTDAVDFATFQDCSSGILAGSTCQRYDFNLDGEVDLLDWGTFTRAYTGDCGIRVADDPQGATVCSGESVTMNVSADRVADGFQWQRNGFSLPGETADTLVIDSVTPESAGFYAARVIGDCHSAVSEAAVVEVDPLPAVEANPEDTLTCEGGSATFSAKGSGLGPLTYRWFRGNTLIGGAAESTLVVEDVTDDMLGDYRCEVRSRCGTTVLSETATLGYHQPVALNSNPVSGEFCAGSDVTLFVSAIGAVDFQWFKDGEPLEGETLFFLSVPDAGADDAGSYMVKAFGHCDEADSKPAVVTVVDCG